jgi:hypothetical protein
MAEENRQGDAKVSSADEHRKTSAGANQTRSRTRPLKNQRIKQGFGTFLSSRVRGVSLPHSDNPVLWTWLANCKNAPLPGSAQVLNTMALAQFRELPHTKHEFALQTGSRESQILTQRPNNSLYTNPLFRFPL